MISSIDKVLVDNFSDCMKTITELSFNSTDQKKFYSSNFQLYCFDSIVKKQLNSKSKSADGLYMSDTAIFFIEFKEGSEKNIKTENIKLKLFEGLNSLYKILVDKSQTQVDKSEFWKLEFVYIVIYRASERSSSFGRALTNSSVKWGLKEYEGLYISKALTEYKPQMVEHIFKVITKDECISVKLDVT